MFVNGGYEHGCHRNLVRLLGFVATHHMTGAKEVRHGRRDLGCILIQRVDRNGFSRADANMLT